MVTQLMVSFYIVNIIFKCFVSTFFSNMHSRGRTLLRMALIKQEKKREEASSPCEKKSEG